MAATKNYNDLCRLCASNLNLLIGINIYDAEGNVREIDKKITSCLPIQIHEADSLPKRICEECVYKLDLFCTFREKSIETENLLIELLQRDKLSIVEKEPKILTEQRQTMNIVTTINNHHQQLHIVENSQDLLNHSNLSLNHTLTARDNLLVSSELGLNHDLESIEITASDLNSHGISPDNLHSQQLALHHHESTMVHLVQQEMHNMTNSHLSVQHLDILHDSPHHIITGAYDLQDKNLESDQNVAEQQSLLIIKSDADLFVKVEGEIKSENRNNLNLVKPGYTDASGSDSDDSIDDLDTNNDLSSAENSKADDLIENTFNVDPLHIESHSSQQVLTSEQTDYTSYYCNTCGVTIKNKDDYLDHCGEHLKKCLVCQTHFSTVEELYLHRNKIHPRSSPTQKIESQPIATHKVAKKDQIDENFFKDESSDEDGRLLGVNSNESLNKGDESDNEEKKNKRSKSWKLKVCSECGKTYKTNYKLAEHMRKHTGEQPFKCRMCDKAFRSKIGLAQHEAKHIGHFEYACPTCGKGFQCKSYLIVHQRAHSTEKPYHCSTCSRNFKTKQSLVDHENRHLGVKPFMCDICGRGFITKGLCKSHQKVHSGRDNRQFPCLVCNKLFVSKSYLNTHAKIHTGEKPFICEVCGKGFLTRVDLKIHSTMHTGEKSFVCEMCGKAFARRDALRCHRRSHTGERPYRCDVCGQTFTQFSPMAIHKRIHTGERPYICDVCPKTFISRSTMMSHKKKHSPNELEGIVS